MAIHADARAAEAVASLADPTLLIEIIVVNTGSGSLGSSLVDVLDRVVLIESPRLRLPGGTRNLGLAEARGPIVAFLAADCLATPGWLARRIAAHAEADAVASAILPAPEANGRVALASLATHMLVYCRRDPDFSGDRTGRYGVSYRREVFARHGTFREDRMVGEDTDFNARLPVRPAWEPDVVTLHRNPSTFAASLADSWQRGARLWWWMTGQTRHPTLHSLRWAIGAAIVAMTMLKYASPERRGSLLAAAPLVWCLALARLGGALWQSGRKARP
jgi:glycosyltransferase involved in cell wall biosynthesis